jgi:type III pantothenate kinase
VSAQAGQVLWLFDVGNTRLKARWSRGGHAGATEGLDWTNPDLGGRLRRLLARWPPPIHILVASVASAERAGCLRRILQSGRGGDAQWLISPRQGCGIVNAYRRPGRLGIDRFLAMAGARALSGGAPLVVVGCGTALTLDAVDGEGRQLEGLIAPSPALMRHSLLQETAIVEGNPDAFHDDGNAATDDTHRAIHAGCQAAAVALVESFHARQVEALGSAALWLHGGGAPALRAALARHAGAAAQLREDLVWRGLEIWAASRPHAGGGA